jgi:hypothetical protein
MRSGAPDEGPPSFSSAGAVSALWSPPERLISFIGASIKGARLR